MNETATATIKMRARGDDGDTFTVTEVPVMAERTETPGLVVTPEMIGGRFLGGWTLTHEASGYSVPLGWEHDDLDTARRAAAALGRTPVDWTADLATVTAQITEHKGAVMDAVREGRYPAPVPDEDDAETDDGPAPYPRTETQATAEALTKNLIRSSQIRAKRALERPVGDEKPGFSLVENAGILVTEFALAYVLRAFAKVDQRAADYAARSVWLAWEDGGEVHELTWELAKEYGLPTEVGNDEEPA